MTSREHGTVLHYSCAEKKVGVTYREEECSSICFFCKKVCFRSLQLGPSIAELLFATALNLALVFLITDVRLLSSNPTLSPLPLLLKQAEMPSPSFLAYYFLKLHIHHFSKIKVIKKSPNSRNQDFFYYFCLMIEGSEAGSVPRTSGSGSEAGRPKNTRIRIRNTG